MSNKSGNLMSQLSGLRLMDGSVVGARVSTTPPTLSSLSPHTTPGASSPATFPSSATSPSAAGATVTTTTTAAAAGGDPRSGTHSSHARHGSRADLAEKESDGAGSLTEKINRLIAQNQGSLCHSSSPPPADAAAGATRTGSSATSSPTRHASRNGSSIISSLAAQLGKSTPPSASAGNGTVKATAPAPRSAVLVVPKPRSVETAAATTGAAVNPATSAANPSGVVVTSTVSNNGSSSATETLNPKVMEFFNNAAVHATISPPPLTDTNSVLKVAVPLSGLSSPSARASAAAAGAATSNHHRRASPSKPNRVSPTGAAVAAGAPNARSGPRSSIAPTQRHHSEVFDQSNQFLTDAFGALDNWEATKPIICTAPEIARDGRYIIVGDLHGCVDQLEQIVEKVKYVKGKDCLIIIGDYVNKGPDSIGVVRACQRLGAYGVLGNHDYTLLKCCARMRRRPFTPDDLRDPVKRLAQKFPRDCENYLRALPHMLRIPRYNLLLVHAGLNVEHSLEHQNVVDVMHLRRLEAVPKKPGSFRAIAKGMEGEPWGTLWAGPETVIFGHDAFSGFQAHPHAYGIDTGCVYGDPLTCVVYGEGSDAGEFFSVVGLPKLENEMKGLPPPNSDIYEQHEGDLEKMIIRPTSRATPAINGSFGGKPVFLAAPLGYSDGPAAVAADAAFIAGFGSPNAKPSNLTATMTSTNAFMNSSSTSPPNLCTPTCPTNIRLMETTTMNTREVQRATLLALSATRQLSAIAVLLGMPLYANEIDAMLGAEATDDVSQEAFWVPFTRLVLLAAAAMTNGAPSPSAKAIAEAEVAVELACDVCGEMEAVAVAVQQELKDFLDAEMAHPAWPKRIVKNAETLVD